MKEKNNKGITLIALAVTIIVILILAGISINLIFGENSIIKQAKNQKKKAEVALLKNIVTSGKVMLKQTMKWGFLLQKHLKNY